MFVRFYFTRLAFSNFDYYVPNKTLVSRTFTLT
jgi:hypothetical protein